MEHKFTFSKEEKLCLKKQISNIFEHGRWLKSDHLRLVYFLTDEAGPSPVQILFSVPKKMHRKAVTRNLIKRRLREAYRLNNNTLYDHISNKGTYLKLSIVYYRPEIVDFKTIEKELKFLLQQLVTRVR